VKKQRNQSEKYLHSIAIEVKALAIVKCASAVTFYRDGRQLSQINEAFKFIFCFQVMDGTMNFTLRMMREKAIQEKDFVKFLFVFMALPYVRGANSGAPTVFVSGSSWKLKINWAAQLRNSCEEVCN
jgi:hypothetical protein